RISPPEIQHFADAQACQHPVHYGQSSYQPILQEAAVMQREQLPPTIRQPKASSEPTSSLVSRLIGPTKASIPTWGILPLRFFLGITFVYAGLDKVTSSTFFNPNGGPQFIGNQLQFAASNSALLGGLLSAVVDPVHHPQ